MPAARDPDLAVARITAATERRIAAICPEELALARRTLRHLPPERWALEWQLPWWLGRAFGLSPRRCEALVIGNLLGLVALHLEDGLRDGDVPDVDVPSAARLSPRLLEAALSSYEAVLPRSSPFRRFADEALDRWRAAQQAGEPTTPDPGPRGPALVDRAAPVRVAAFAVCLLAGREDAWPRIDRCLGHALAALVRYDQLVDWMDDLAAGRWNSFVAAVAPGPQDRAHTERNRAAVQVALLTAGAAAEQYRQVEADARAAASLAFDLGVVPLARYLEDYGHRTAAERIAVQHHYDGIAAQATELLFGSRASA
jgi:hypothetical protein